MSTRADSLTLLGFLFWGLLLKKKRLGFGVFCSVEYSGLMSATFYLIRTPWVMLFCCCVFRAWDVTSLVDHTFVSSRRVPSCTSRFELVEGCWGSWFVKF